MTFPLGLSAPLLEAFEQQKRQSHQMRVLIELLDFRHLHVADLNGSRISGAVQVRTDGEGVTRSLQVEIEDHVDILGLGDGRAPVTPNRMVAVKRGTFVESHDLWVDVPVFMGPISAPIRTGDVLSIEAQDKAQIAMDARKAYTLKKGTNVATAIRALMLQCVGERRFRIATTGRKLTRDYTTSFELAPWALLQSLVSSLGWVAFYDGAGYLVARPRSTVPVTHFGAGPNGLLASGVRTAFWNNDIVNQVTVVGKTISGVKVSATVTANARDPLSPEAMAFEGVAWPRNQTVNDSQIATYPQAVVRATEVLRELMIQQTTASFDCIPFEHLQEYDPFTVDTPAGVVTSSFTEGTIPLQAEYQSMGTTARTAASSRALRVRAKSKKLIAAERRVRKAKAEAAARKRRAAARKRAAAKRRAARKKRRK